MANLGSVSTGQTAITANGPVQLGSGRTVTGVLVSSSSAVFIGGGGINSGTGMLIPANAAPIKIPVSNLDELYAITASGPATVTWMVV